MSRGQLNKGYSGLMKLWLKEHNSSKGTGKERLFRKQNEEEKEKEKTLPNVYVHRVKKKIHAQVCCVNLYEIDFVKNKK